MFLARRKTASSSRGRSGSPRPLSFMDEVSVIFRLIDTQRRSLIMAIAAVKIRVSSQRVDSLLRDRRN